MRAVTTPRAARGRHRALTSARPSTPVTDVVAIPSHEVMGFLRMNRRRLAIVAGTAAFLLAAMQQLPASSASVASDAVTGSSSQSFEVAAAAVEPDTSSRDGFGVTEFDLVQYPVDPATTIASPFGHRVSPCSGCSSDHQGVDYDAGYGAQVAAIADGVVIEASYTSDYGQHVFIQHEIDGQTVVSVYGHLIAGSSPMRAGQTVARGDLVGLLGSTGASSGPHLHFEIRVGGVNASAIEPTGWLAANVTQPWGQ